MNNKKSSYVPVDSDTYNILKQEASDLSVPVNKLLPALIFSLKDKVIMKNTISRLLNIKK